MHIDWWKNTVIKRKLIDFKTLLWRLSLDRTVCLSPSSFTIPQESMFVDEEIQDDTETPDAFGMYGDSTHQADYSADHHQPALRYNTPEDSESSDDLETDRTSISDFNSTPTFHLGDMEDEEDHQMEQEFHHDNMDSTPLQTVNMFPPEMHETENPEIQQESTSTENNPAPKYHYWLRERKPKKLNEYGDVNL